MKKGKEQIDRLFEQNEKEQLKSFNWDQLHSLISKRLDQADHNQTSLISLRYVFKITAGIAAAAAVVIIAVMVQTNLPTKVKYDNSNKGVVTFIESKNSAKVEILDSSEQENQVKDRPTWIIIRSSEPKVASNGQSRDEDDFACLM